MKNTFFRFFSKSWYNIAFFAMGLSSLAWFLVRVIPKPSRAYYPCMRAAAPLASTFVIYLLGITSFTLMFKKARQRVYESRYWLASIFAVLALGAGAFTIYHTNSSAAASDNEPQELQTGNQPVGTAKGIFPGRVVWVHNPDATNEDCENIASDYWYMDINTDQAIVSAMVSSSIQQLTGTSNDEAAWDSIFVYYNRTHGKGSVGYTAGEKIVIKINLNGIYNGSPDKNINTSPQICYAILDQLVNNAGVAEANISIGDPNCSMNAATFDKIDAAFPDVICWGNGGGRTAAAATAEPVLIASDGSFEDALPQDYIDADYMINMPVFKKHHRAGISLCSKNHFGSFAAYTGGAWHAHPSLPCPETSDVINGDYGAYRCFVDIMGHKDLGGKTILYMIDGIWGSTNWGHPPVKWRMAPFNNDWPSSIFTSLDPVAIESVGYDFLYHEFDPEHPTEGYISEDVHWVDGSGPFSRFKGADDFLHQAASPANWAQGIEYDPENDGTVLTSMGTHEHWNNATAKLYTRNMGTGNGIELVSQYTPVALPGQASLPEGYEILSNYPNPFSESTTIRFRIADPSDVNISVYNTTGQLVHSYAFDRAVSGTCEYTWNGKSINGNAVAKGSYICSIEIRNSKGKFTLSNQMLAIK